MKKIKKNLLRIFSSFVAYLFSYSWLSAQGNVDSNSLYIGGHYVGGVDNMYGVEYEQPTLTLWEKITSFILSPLIIIIVVALAFGVGIAIYFLRKRRNKKNVKKDF